MKTTVKLIALQRIVNWNKTKLYIARSILFKEHDDKKSKDIEAEIEKRKEFNMKYGDYISDYYKLCAKTNPEMYVFKKPTKLK